MIHDARAFRDQIEAAGVDQSTRAVGGVSGRPQRANRAAASQDGECRDTRHYRHRAAGARLHHRVSAPLVMAADDEEIGGAVKGGHLVVRHRTDQADAILQRRRTQHALSDGVLEIVLTVDHRQRRAIEAAQRAIASPLLEAGAIDGARGILINITGSTSLKLAEVQQACSIIQSAAHEDATIIFGAVMDEKMKDAVKITVIATGFREAPTTRHRHQETRTSFAAQHDEAMDFPEAFEPRDPMLEPPKHIMSEPDRSREQLEDDRHFMEEPASSVAPASEHVAEVVPLDSMRSSVLSNMTPNFEHDDLDVPAFLRKRNDVM